MATINVKDSSLLDDINWEELEAMLSEKLGVEINLTVVQDTHEQSLPDPPGGLGHQSFYQVKSQNLAEHSGVFGKITDQVFIANSGCCRPDDHFQLALSLWLGDWEERRRQERVSLVIVCWYFKERKWIYEQD